MSIMKRKIAIAFLLVCMFCMSGCGFEKSKDQITQLDTRYLQGEEKEEKEEQTTEVQATENPQETSVPSGEKQQENKEEKDNSTTVEKKATPTPSKVSKKAKEKSVTKSTSKIKTKKKTDSSKNASDKNVSEKKSESKKDAVSTPNPTSVKPEEPEKQTCTIAIDCKTILSNRDKLNSAKKAFVPSDGWILKTTKVEIEDGDSVYDILNRVCRKNKIHLEAAYTPAYKTYYVEGIHQLYEFDCGDLSGWTYKVNGKSSNYGASKYQVKAGDTIRWRYTCDGGKDIGDDYFD